jgi:hypothetical protein
MTKIFGQSCIKTKCGGINLVKETVTVIILVEWNTDETGNWHCYLLKW